MSKSYVTVADCAMEARSDIGRRKLDNESAMTAMKRSLRVELTKVKAICSRCVQCNRSMKIDTSVDLNTEMRADGQD